MLENDTKKFCPFISSVVAIPQARPSLSFIKGVPQEPMMDINFLPMSGPCIQGKCAFWNNTCLIAQYFQQAATANNPILQAVQNAEKIGVAHS